MSCAHQEKLQEEIAELKATIKELHKAYWLMRDAACRFSFPDLSGLYDAASPHLDYAESISIVQSLIRDGKLGDA